MTIRRGRWALLLTATGVLSLVACHVQIGSAPTGGASAPPVRGPQLAQTPAPVQPPPPRSAPAANPRPSAPLRLVSRRRPGPAPAAATGLAPATPNAPAPAPAAAPPAPSARVADIAEDVGSPPGASELATKARRSPTKLVSPHKTTPPPSASNEDIVASRDAASFYASSESTAAPALRADLTSIRSTLTRERRSYQVGVTAVSDRPLARINGGATPIVDEAELARAAAVRASKPGKSNLLSRELHRRVALPARLRAQETARVNSGEAIVTERAVPTALLGSPYAASFSWRDRMTPIRDQGDCGSCWAFATMGVLEALHNIHSGQRGLDLSEQHLVNCAPNPFRTHNCEQNSSASVWKFLLESGGATETAVPYKGRVLSCNRSAGTSAYKIEDWGYAGERYTRPTVEEIKAAMVTHGPIVALVNSTRSFQHYTGGVFDDRDNNSTNHLIVLVGWDDKKGAWLLRNSWSSRWGEGGYMWIKYGSNAVGAYATWAEPAQAPPPPVPTFPDRYLSLVNESGEALKVSLGAEVPDGAGFRWVPAAPGPAAATWTVNVPAGATVDVRRPDNAQFLTARSARIWATSADGRRSWTAFKSKDWVLAQGPYKAATRERSTFYFGKPDAPQPSADGLFNDATTARRGSDWVRAARLYAEFVGRFPSEPRVHSARFLLGFAHYKQKRYDPALVALAESISSAPTGDPNIPFSLYYIGMADALQGDCGSAVRAFELVAHAELDAPTVWVKAAQRNITQLENDDGTLCSNWD